MLQDGVDGIAVEAGSREAHGYLLTAFNSVSNSELATEMICAEAA
jgi:hypothetical protein